MRPWLAPCALELCLPRRDSNEDGAKNIPAGGAQEQGTGINSRWKGRDKKNLFSFICYFFNSSSLFPLASGPQSLPSINAVGARHSQEISERETVTRLLLLSRCLLPVGAMMVLAEVVLENSGDYQKLSGGSSFPVADHLAGIVGLYTVPRGL